MKLFIDFLHDHPVIGAITAGTSFTIPFFDFINPILQFAVLCLGIVVAGITITEKIKRKRDS